MAYSARSSNGLTLWRVFGTGTSVNTFSEILDDNPDGIVFALGGTWVNSVGNEWTQACTTIPDGEVAAQDVLDRVGATAWLVYNGGGAGALNAGEWDWAAGVLTVRLFDDSDPNASDPYAYYLWSNFMTEHVEDRMYEIHKRFLIGNGTDTTTLTTKNEIILIHDDDASYDWIEEEATFQMGELQDGYGINGSMLILDATFTTTRYRDIQGVFKAYGSQIDASPEGSTSRVYIRGDSSQNQIDFVDTHTNHCQIRPRYNTWGNPLSNMQRVLIYVTDAFGLYVDTDDVTDWEDVIAYGHLGFSNPGTYTITSASIDGDIRVYTNYGKCVVKMVNPIMTPKAPTTIGYATSYLSWIYTLNINISGKSGNALSGVRVIAVNKNGIPVFSKTTNSDGDIAEQEVEVERYTGLSETHTTYTPHKIVFSKAGFKTLTYENITLDEPTSWHIEMIPSPYKKKIGEDF